MGEAFLADFTISKSIRKPVRGECGLFYLYHNKDKLNIPLFQLNLLVDDSNTGFIGAF